MQVSLFDRSHISKKYTFTHEGLTGCYYVVGDAKGMPIVFLHGLTGSHIGLLPLAAHLSRFCCILLDLPGHSSAPIPLSSMPIHLLDDWVSAFVDRWKGAVVVAHSYGGSLAVLALNQNPDSIAGCILLNPIAQTSSLARSYRNFASLLRPTFVAALNDIDLLRHERHAYLLERSTPAVIKIMKQLNEAEMFIKTSREQMAYFQRLGKYFDDLTIFKNAKKPLIKKTFCVVASHDRLVSPRNTAFLQEIFNKSHVYVCADSGHLMPVEAIDDTAKIVNKILKRITKPAATTKSRLTFGPKP